MPSWNIHLAVAKKVNKKYNLDKNSFYLGNLIADINFNPKLKRRITHYNTSICKNCPKELLPNLNEFLKDYKDNIKTSSLLLGYYSHLLTDYFYNNYIFSNCWVQNEKNEIIGVRLINGRIIKNESEDKKILKKYKHDDLELYGKYLFNNNYIDIPKTFNYKNNDLSLLKNKFFKSDDARTRINYLNTEFISSSKYTLKEKIFGLKYKILTKEKLDELFNECINFMIENIDKILN